MPTKKQVRRRLKERRHEWEEVYVDADGNEVEPPTDAEVAAGTARSTKKASRTPARSSGRVIQPPSWQRVGKRSAIFAPLMYITVILLAPDGTSLVEAITQTLFLLLIFIPFSYAMDVMTYRMWRRRTGRVDPGRKP